MPLIRDIWMSLTAVQSYPSHNARNMTAENQLKTRPTDKERDQMQYNDVEKKLQNTANIQACYI